ncbi:MAG: tetratricopeptide repeat protein [Pseudomonadota bacterium]
MVRRHFFSFRFSAAAIFTLLFLAGCGGAQSTGETLTPEEAARRDALERFDDLLAIAKTARSPEAHAALAPLCDEDGLPVACAELAKMYRIPLYGAKRDAEKSVAYAQKGCDLGDGRQCESAGRWFAFGRDGIERDKAKAYALYKRGCDLGWGKACFSQAFPTRELVKNENITRAEAVKAAQALNQKGAALLEGVCAENDAEACFELGEFKTSAAGGPDYDGAQIFLKKSCDLSFVRACISLAVKYANGTGVALSADDAFRYYFKACANGSRSACAAYQNFTATMAGVRKRLGEDCKKLPSKLSALRVAYERRCYNYSITLAEGIGGPVDEAGAEKTRRMLCDYGFQKACDTLTASQ